MFLNFLLFFLFIFFQAQASSPDGFINPMKQEIFLITPYTFENIIGRLRSINGVSLLLHFSSKNDKLKSFINNTFNEAAKETNGMLRFAAIDCSKWTRFCKENLNSELLYPRVVVYPPYPIPPFSLDNPDKKKMIQQAIRYISGEHIENINSSTINNFLNQNIAIPKVLLFSNKKHPPTIYKALSNTFSDRLNFAFINSSESSLLKKYKIKDVPKVLIFRSSSRTPEIYDGPIKYTNLHEWLNVRAETFVKGGGFSNTGSQQEVNKPWLEQRIPELTLASHQSICFKQRNLCAIYLSKGNITTQEIEKIESLSKEYSNGAAKSVKFNWMWMDIEKEIHFRELFSINLKYTPSFVVINPHKRLRFMALKPPEIATEKTMKQQLEKIIAGDGRFILFKDKKLPRFVTSSKPQDQPKIEEL